MLMRKLLPLLLVLFSSTSIAMNSLTSKSSVSTKPISILDCDVSKCGEKEVEKRTKGLMCLCEKVALASVTNAGVGLTSTNEGDDNAPYPGYLRANYANNLQVTPSSTICHGMVVSKLIDAKKCLVSCSIMEQYIRAASGQDAMVCQKAVEESGIVIDGNILGEDDEDDKKVGLSGGGASSLLRL